MLSQEFNLTIDKAYAALNRLGLSIYWQGVYSCSKEGHVKLFKNDRDLTSIQLDFIRTLGYYYDVITDVSANSVNEFVLSDDIYIKAYVHYKSSKYKKEKANIKKDEVIQNSQQAFNKKYKPTDTYIFRKK